MVKVHFRKITRDNLRSCLSLQVYDLQLSLVATPAQSLAEAYVDPNLFSLAIYDAAACGYEQPQVPVIGLLMYEIVAGVGFIMRLTIDRQYQRQDYGRAAMTEIIRRLKLFPDVEIIATSYRQENEVATRLYQGLGFREWDISFATAHPTEVYVKLEE
jgi:diamine N-acetyltransferase